MNTGKLTLITGCMFSGKTTELIKRAEEAVRLQKKIEVYYPVIDTRYGRDHIFSHSKLRFKSLPLPLDTSYIEKAEHELVLIDELHFFEENIVKAIEELLLVDTNVVVGGLDRNFRGEFFPVTEKVKSIADDVVSLAAVCVVCAKPALFTQRKLDGRAGNETIVVGGAELYEARCADCFVKPE